MNLTEDIKPFSTPLINPHCERSFVKPRETHYSYPADVRQLNGATVSNHLLLPVNPEVCLDKVAKSEFSRGNCVLERHNEEGRSPRHSEATVLNTNEASFTSYSSLDSAGTHHPKDESYSHVRNAESAKPYIVQPATIDGCITSQSNGVAPKAISAQTGHPDKRAERFDAQSFPCSSAQLSYRGPHPCFTTYPSQRHIVPSSNTAQAFPQKRPQETWNLALPIYPVYVPYPWYGERQPCPDMNGLNHCGATPIKDFPVYREEGGRPSIRMDDMNQDKDRREVRVSSYPNGYETLSQSLHREIEVRGGSYVASTASAANIHEQHRYGGAHVQPRPPQDQSNGYYRQNWTQRPDPESHQNNDVEAQQNLREQRSVTSLHGNSQAVAYIADGRFNGLAADVDKMECTRYSPRIIDCYSLANTDSPTKDSPTPSEPPKSPGVPSMAFYDDRIHHQTVASNYQSVRDFHAHAHHAIQSGPVRVQPRDVAEPCAQDARNQRTTPTGQAPRARSSWKAEMSCRISFHASVDGDRASRDQWRSRAWSSMDNTQKLLGFAQCDDKTPSVQSASPSEYRIDPHLTNCDVTSTSQRQFPEQRDPGPSAPVHKRTSLGTKKTTLVKHGSATRYEREDEKLLAVIVRRKKRHSYPDNQPRSSKAAKWTSSTRFRLSPDITQRRREENSPNPFKDLVKTSSFHGGSGVQPRAQTPSDQPGQNPHQIRITAQGGVISVENVFPQKLNRSPVSPCGEPQSPEALHEQIAQEWDIENQDDSSSCKTPEEIPDLSEYAKAFNITDIDECDVDETLTGSNGYAGEEHDHVDSSPDHGVCFYSNSFCCGALSRSPSQFKNLLDTAPKEKRFPCRFCGRRFAHLSTLQNHVRVHTGDRPYLCKYCDKSFAQSGVLKTHLRTHTGDKPFQCPFCGRLFAQSTTLTNHLRIHTGHKPFICKYCSKAFSQPSTLRKHEISHTNERPYPCKVCGRAFVQQSTLNNHMRSHTGQKPYKCPFCGRGFAQLSTMDRHLKIHTSFRYKPHQCPYCDKDFSYLSNLTNHLQTHSKPLSVVS